MLTQFNQPFLSVFKNSCHIPGSEKCPPMDRWASNSTGLSLQVPSAHMLSNSKCSGEGDGTPLQYSCLENPMDGGAWWAAVHGVAKSQTRLSDFTLTFHFHALEKEMATHSSVLAWRIPETGEPGGLPSMGSHRVGHDWSDLAAAAAAASAQGHWPRWKHLGHSSTGTYACTVPGSTALSAKHVDIQGFSHREPRFVMAVKVPNLISSLISFAFWTHQPTNSLLFEKPKTPASLSSVAQPYPTICDPWTAAHQASLSITNSESMLKLMSIKSVMSSNHLILYRPLLLPPSIFPSIRVFFNESVLHIRDQSTGVSASASVLPVNTQDWFPLWWTGLIALQSKRLSRVFSNTTIQKHQFFGAQLSSQSNSHIDTWPLEKP